MVSEFDLIKKYFKRTPRRALLGVGDDCALFRCRRGRVLAVSTDMLVSGTHFFPDVDPYWLGVKTIVVNLSDLAAMGAEPLACTLAVSLPEANEEWVEKFSKGFFSRADEYGCEVIGGDTTKGPLNLCVTVFGEVEPDKAFRRDAAQTGDDIYVSNTLGGAAAALAVMLGKETLTDAGFSLARIRLEVPIPQLVLAKELKGLVRAALDISDGLVGDLGHILEESGKGAVVNVDAIPIHPALMDIAQDRALSYALTGGDDYELCFTAPPENREAIFAAAERAKKMVTVIGTVTDEPGKLVLKRGNGKAFKLKKHAFDHFK